MRGLAFPTFLAAALAAIEPSAAADQDGGILSEVRLGVLMHDAGIITDRVEPAGPDANLEILFGSPGFLDVIWSPRPHIGATLNPDGATSKGYLGLTWDWAATDRVFAEVSLGGSVHNGKLESLSAGPDEKALGCRVLFRESVSLGYRMTDHYNVSVMADHVSNGYLCDTNPGLDTVGLRFGYRF